MDLALCKGHCHVETEKGCLQTWKHTKHWSKISLYAITSSVHLVGTKVPGLNPENSKAWPKMYGMYGQKYVDTLVHILLALQCIMYEKQCASPWRGKHSHGWSIQATC